MADIVNTRTLLQAREELRKVANFNKGKDGQYNYVYIVPIGNEWMVRVSKQKPTSKKAKYVRKM